MIEQYFEVNYPAGTFERIKKVLQGKPFIGGSKGIIAKHIIEERVALIFEDRTEKLLAPEGTVYDYFVLAREKYQGEPALVQIKTIIERKREEPKWLRYELNNNGCSQPEPRWVRTILEDNEDSFQPFGPVLVPYEKVKELIALVESTTPRSA